MHSSCSIPLSFLYHKYFFPILLFTKLSFSVSPLYPLSLYVCLSVCLPLFLSLAFSPLLFVLLFSTLIYSIHSSINFIFLSFSFSFSLSFSFFLASCSQSNFFHLYPFLCFISHALSHFSEHAHLHYQKHL